MKTDIKTYELMSLDKAQPITRFVVVHTRKICHQDIVNRIVELGYNPLLYYWRDA